MKNNRLLDGASGIHSHDRNTGADSAVNVIFHQLWIGHRNQNAGCLLLHGLLKRLLLGLGVIAIRARELSTHLELRSGLHKTRPCRLPIRHLKIGGDEVILFVSIVAGSATYEREKQDAEEEQGSELRLVHRILLKAIDRHHANGTPRRYAF